MSRSKSYSDSASVLRIASILGFYSPRQLEFSAPELSKKLGISRTTTYRILSTMAKVGLLEVTDHRYRVGPALYATGVLYLNSMDAIKAAKPVMKELNELMKEDVLLGILNGGNIVMIAKEECKYDIRLGQHIGAIWPAYGSAMGLALLSELTDEEINGLYPEKLPIMTEHTIPTRRELKEKLLSVRLEGVSFESQGGWQGTEGIGTVIRNASGKSIAAISIGVPVYRMNQTKRAQCAALIRLGASLISYRLGYQDQDNVPVRNIEEIRNYWRNRKDLKD